jgi:uncharacterized membrane protein YgcG
MRRLRGTNRRGTLLLMVVGLLASLFMIISAFLTLARSDNRQLQSTQRADKTDAILRSADNIVLSAIRQSWADGKGNLLTAGWKNPLGTTAGVEDRYSPEDVPGTRGTNWLSGPEFVRNHAPELPTAPPPGSIADFRVHWSIGSSFDGASTPRQLPLIGWGPDDFGGYPPGSSKPGLMLEYAGDTDGIFGTSPADDDFARNARRPFMDADGDGVPDSFFVGMGPLTEMANAIAGTSVRAPQQSGTLVFNPSAVPSGGTADEIALATMWQRFDEQAKYELAVKVESNGGKVALASPGVYGAWGSVWNREFVVGMFNWIRHPNDAMVMPLDPRNPNLPTFDQIEAAAPKIEPYLRYRGGLLPTYLEPRPYGPATLGLAIPSVLRTLEQADVLHFPYTFIPDGRVDGGGVSMDQQWPRFNLALQYEFSNWNRAATIDADAFNVNYSATSPPLASAPAQYSRRRLLTTISNSDELARNIDPRWPDSDLANPNRAHPPDNPPGSHTNYLDPDMGIYAGALKFYLGDVSRAFDASTGYYIADDIDALSGLHRGNQVVRRLANYYYEMLTPYGGWGNVQDVDQDPTGSIDETVSRRQQAFMLAVNTVAFGAPRTADPQTGARGFIDAVWYTDTEPPSGVQRTYLGYAPQLFITEAIAYCEGKDDSDPEHVTTGQIAVAVELYNPNDPNPSLTGNPTEAAAKFTYGDGADDPFALDLDQFGLSISAPGAPLTIYRLSDTLATAGRAGHHLTGRNFMTVSLDDGWADSPLRSHCDGRVENALPETYLDPSTNRREIIVKLWRRGGPASTQFWVVDRMVLGDAQVEPGDGTGSKIEIPPMVGSGQDKEMKWIVDYYRDCKDEIHFKRQWPAGQAPARWRMATNLRRARGDQKEPDSSDPIQVSFYTTNLGSDLPAPAASFAPTVPLYTMNAGDPQLGSAPAWWRAHLPDTADQLHAWFFGQNPIHGAYRPASFPTVGFMHFIPRFSHVTGAKDAIAADVLRKQWKIREHGAGASSGGTPGGTSGGAAGSSGGTPGGFGGTPGSGSGESSGGGSSSGVVWSASTGEYAADFGHMPIFDNNQKLDAPVVTGPGKPYFDDSQAGRIPWGLLVYDYFTTIDPKADYDQDVDHKADVDPRRVPGRIDINTAPWYVLAGLPVINPERTTRVEIDHSASPAFWSPVCGVLAGAVDQTETAQVSYLPGGLLRRSPVPVAGPPVPNNLLLVDSTNGWLRLGPYYAQAIASYRDRLAYASDAATLGAGQNPLWSANLRNSPVDYRLESDGSAAPVGDGLGGFFYGPIRHGAGTGDNPRKYGFLSLGELANVKGFDSPVYSAITGARTDVAYNPLGQPHVVGRVFIYPDFFKAVSLLALLDTQFLTTRSNTFTVYMTLMNRDPDQQQSSVRVQYTVDRSNLLPQLAVDPVTGEPMTEQTRYIDSTTGRPGEAPIMIQNDGLPEIVTRREVGYYDMQYDQ